MVKTDLITKSRFWGNVREGNENSNKTKDNAKTDWDHLYLKDVGSNNGSYIEYTKII